ncbi:DUF6338 family protein [Streptomyces sp. NBC_01381]|uniref:DUF6338 family protein n=1 Tax=Streptomyces sp. NBC_01381 TaxID=2903845 RepID=UPI0022522900|nr:DUF6338 family protein [Streptomyces sp. NBC_01381]MCX4671952.1 DUF6338 family protein [Streptomyces sp. NBC_01381]
MPSGLLGLVALLFVAVPGHLYLVRYERRSLRERPGAAREITELFAVGAFVTLASAAGVFVLAEAVPGLATLDGTASGAAYLRSHPWHLARSGILILAVSALVCAALGELRGRRNGGTWSNAPGTVWSELLKPSRGEADPEVRVLLDDGTRVHGSGHMVSDERDTYYRDVALHHPISIYTAGEDRPQPSDADYVIIPGGHIRLIQITTVRRHDGT